MLEMRNRKSFTAALAVTVFALAYMFISYVGRKSKTMTVQVRGLQFAHKPLVHCGDGATTNHLQETQQELKWTKVIKSAIHDPRIAVNMADDIATRETRFADKLTVVTAYINIGEFQKGEDNSYFTPILYRKWMTTFRLMTNPVIAYFDQQSDADYFRLIRSIFPPNMTRIIILPREQLWAFNSLKPRISQIYADPKYPKHHPNTVLADYSCAMHAKYELMLRSVHQNPFQTKYFAWVDIGLFRELTGKQTLVTNDNFSLYIPPRFESDKVAYGRVGTRVKNVPLSFIFHDNLSWVCGCFFVAKASVMARWTFEYMKYADYYLCRDLMNTDQQILYAMFNYGRPAVQIQDYRPRHEYNIWFSLGYVCKEEGSKQAGGFT